MTLRPPLASPPPAALILGYPPGTAVLREAVLRRCGFAEVACPASEEEALPLLFAKPMDLLLLDGSGWLVAPALIGTLRRHRACASRRAHMIVTLEEIDAPQLDRLRHAGVSQIAPEPLGEDELAARIGLMRRDRRTFIDSPDYCGPSRRARQLARYGLMPRRSTDYALVRHRAG